MHKKKIVDYKLNIIKFFLELEATIQLYHWYTTKFSRHKASDFLYENALQTIDKFMEVYIGRYGRSKTDFNEVLIIKKYSDDKFITYLQNTVEILEVEFSKVLLENETDLLNIRDELLGFVNQTLYLFTLE